ncbi:MAG: chemotaxis response regulator protein-glutamate methylesterase [Candidatus Sulfotelmatobacter sp.]
MSRPSPNPQVRVLIADDSAFMRTALSRMIASDPDLWVAGTASNGNEALEKTVSLDPDVITLDVQMPGLDGIETLRCIMAQFPRPVIMVSSVTLKDADSTFNALSAGAFDYVPKQLSTTSLDIIHIRDDLVAKIKAAGEARRSRSYSGSLRRPPSAVRPSSSEVSPTTTAIIALGTSTGGPKALQDILPLLPADLSVPILVVQHMPAGFTRPFAERLDRLCSLSVCEASNGETARPGVVYIAPAGLHMTVERSTDSRAMIRLSDQPEKQLHTPSVDVTMQSAASAFRSQAMGIIMTGMGSDGVLGMKAIHQAGGWTVGQDEHTCAVYGMPRACAEQGILHRVVPLSQIPQQILQATRHRKLA